MRGGRRESREGEVILVLSPLLIKWRLSVVWFRKKEKGVNHDRSDRGLGAMIGMTPAAMPRESSCYSLKSGA